MTDLPSKIEAEGAPFWRAAEQGKLELPRCESCHRWTWFPRATCPECGAPCQWIATSGQGKLTAFAVERRGVSAGHVQAPYIVGLVTLDEGVSILSNIICCDPDELHAGAALSVTFVKGKDGVTLPVFRRAGVSNQ
jgi:uncharacterized protein